MSGGSVNPMPDGSLMGAGSSASRPGFVDDLAVLDQLCKQLMLRPHDEAARLIMVLAILSLKLAPGARDSSLVRALINEAEAQGQDLAFRLERPGYDAMFIRATAAKYCQTLAVLREQLELRSKA